MISSQGPYKLVISKNDPISTREQGYYRQRFLHTVFEKVATKFAERAERYGLTKAKVARFLGKDPSQINRSLSLPSNMTLEMLSDLALAMGCEPGVTLSDFDVPAGHNFVHRYMIGHVRNASSAQNHGSTQKDGNVNNLISAEVKILELT